jgi:protein SCO1/2
MTVLRIAFLVVLWTISAHAAVQVDLRDFAYQQKPGARLPSNETFRDATGREVRLADLLHGKPAILALGYFSCPNLCGVVRADLYNALSRTGMIAGKDYTLIALSIDPAETSSDAAKAKATDIAQYPLPGAARDWHFLTGSAGDVRAVGDAVGFRDRFDPKLKQFLHPAGLVFITPGGVVSSYLLGVGYAARDVRLGVTRASTGTIAARALPVLLLCFHFDPTTGRYTLAILKLLKLGAGLTVLVVGGMLFLAFRRERNVT